jgi:hypothetical protein
MPSGVYVAHQALQLRPFGGARGPLLGVPLADAVPARLRRLLDGGSLHRVVLPAYSGHADRPFRPESITDPGKAIARGGSPP